MERPTWRQVNCLPGQPSGTRSADEIIGRLLYLTFHPTQDWHLASLEDQAWFIEAARAMQRAIGASDTLATMHAPAFWKADAANMAQEPFGPACF